MTPDEAADRLTTVLDAAGVTYSAANQRLRVIHLSRHPHDIPLRVVKGGGGSRYHADRVIGYTNHRQYGRRVYTIVVGIGGPSIRGVLTPDGKES